MTVRDGAISHAGKNKSGNPEEIDQDVTKGHAHVRLPVSAPDAVTGVTVGTTAIAIATFATDDIKSLGLQLKVATTALNTLSLFVKYHADGDYIDLRVGDNTTNNWKTHGYPVTDSNITNDTAVAIGNSYIDLDVSRFYTIQLRASVGVGSAVVDVLGGGMA